MPRAELDGGTFDGWVAHGTVMQSAKRAAHVAYSLFAYRIVTHTEIGEECRDVK